MDPERVKEIASEGGSAHVPKGFATMDPERQKEIASMGGKVSHSGGRHREGETHDRHREGKRRDAHDHDKTPHLKEHRKGKQGFASMEEETKHRVQSKGGKASHSGAKSNQHDQDRSPQHSSSKDRRTEDRDIHKNLPLDKEEHHKGKQGFASMDEETKHRVQSMGGKASHAHHHTK